MEDRKQQRSWSRKQVLAEMGRSNFCLATTGAGWGVRLKLAVIMGCVPVVVADGVEVGPLFCCMW